VVIDLNYLEYGGSKPKGMGLRQFFFISVLILIGAFMAGCTQYSSQTASPVPIVSKTPDPILGTTPSPAIVGTPTAETKTGQDTIEASVAAAIADGTYAEDSTYNYHSGNETVTFTVTIKDDKIAEVTATPHNPAPMSAKMIAGFNGGIMDIVRGKKIEDINIPKNIGGSSLTTAAFKGYLNKLIETQ
jgi:hypothetical protein